MLLLNDNAFVYLLYDRVTLKLTGLYPLNLILVEPIEDINHNYYLKFYLEDGTNYILPYENVIHLKRFYGKNDMFGGTNSKGDHDAILKTIKVNDNLTQAILKATKSESAIVPIDGKSEYVPLNVDPKLVDNGTLKFLQFKILDY